jgi:hypothetical protein
LLQLTSAPARCVRSCGGCGCVCVRKCWHDLTCAGDRDSSTNKSQLPPGEQIAGGILRLLVWGTRVTIATSGKRLNGRQQWPATANLSSVQTRSRGAVFTGCAFLV